MEISSCNRDFSPDRPGAPQPWIDEGTALRDYWEHELYSHRTLVRESLLLSWHFPQAFLVLVVRP